MDPLSASMRVTLLHNYRERQQMSMKLYADQLGEALLQQGVSVERAIPEDVLPAWLQRLPLGSKVDSYLGRYAAYPRMARRLRSEVFHIVDHGQAHLLRDLDSRRTVVTCHDVILLVLASGRLGLTYRPQWATRLFRQSLRLLPSAGWIVADSEQTRRDLASLANVDPARVTVVFPGMNYPFRPMPEVRHAVRRTYGLGEGPLLLQVGASLFYKNLPGVLRVLQRLRAGGINARLVRTGQQLTPDLCALRDQLGLTDSVHDLGPTTPDELARLYSSADLLLFPSLYEGFGWPPLEAMASGLPVVCSRGGSLPEIVGDAALTAEPEDIPALTDHCAAILSQPALAAQLRERGLANVRRFTWAHTAEQMRSVYQRVLEA